MEFKKNPSSNLTHHEIQLRGLINQIYCSFFANDEEPCDKQQIKNFRDDLKSRNVT